MKSSRRATTLLELILVLVIIVVVAALSVPSLGAMYGYYKLNGAVDSVRGAWAEARAHAIEQGRPYRFSIQPEGNGYRVAPDEDDYWPGQGPSNDPNGKGIIVEESMPAGVRFATGDSAGQPPAEDHDDFVLDHKPVKSGNWKTVAVFNIDGTASEDVRIVFQVRGCTPMALQLRGLTGDVSVENLPH